MLDALRFMLDRDLRTPRRLPHLRPTESLATSPQPQHSQTYSNEPDPGVSPQSVRTHSPAVNQIVRHDQFPHPSAGAGGAGGGDGWYLPGEDWVKHMDNR